MVRLKPEHRPWHVFKQQQGSPGEPAEEISSQYHSEREDLWGLIAPEQPGAEKAGGSVFVWERASDLTGKLLVLCIAFWFEPLEQKLLHIWILSSITFNKRKKKKVKFS